MGHGALVPVRFQKLGGMVGAKLSGKENNDILSGLAGAKLAPGKCLQVSDACPV